MRLRRYFDPAALRAAWWAERELRRARRSLREDGVAAARVADPPRLPLRAGRGVRAVLRRRPNTCLERALVLQSWLAAHGDPREVVIGVRGPGDAFRAHAWVDGVPDGDVEAFEEIMRLPAR